MKRYVLSILGVLGLLVGCDRSSSNNAPPNSAPKESSPAPAAHREDDGHDHGDDTHTEVKTAKSRADHGGAVVELGEATVDGMKIKASRDRVEIKAGGDAPIDVWVMTAEGKPATVAAVRFWIGTENAKGSIKAKSEIERPTEPNHWHTHAEVPNPLPAGAKLWVAVEVNENEEKIASFDLKL